MTFDTLTQEVLKLPRNEMFAITQLLLQALQAQGEEIYRPKKVG